MAQRTLGRLREAVEREETDVDEYACTAAGCGWSKADDPYAVFDLHAHGGGELRCPRCGGIAELREAADAAARRRRRELINTDDGYRAFRHLVASQRQLLVPRGLVPELKNDAAVMHSGDFLSQREYDRRNSVRALVFEDSGGGQAARAERLAAGDDGAVDVELVAATVDESRRRAFEDRKRRRHAQQLPSWLAPCGAAPAPHAAGDDASHSSDGSAGVGAAGGSGGRPRGKKRAVALGERAQRIGRRTLPVSCEHYAWALRAQQSGPSRPAAAQREREEEGEWTSPQQLFVAQFASDTAPPD